MEYVENKSKRKQKLSKAKTKIESIMCIHEEKMKYFKNLQDIILVRKKIELDKKNQNDDTRNLVKEIKDIEDRVEENDYYLSTASILQKYYSIEEDKEDNILTKKDLTIEYYKAICRDIPTEIYKVDIKTNNFNCNTCKGINCIFQYKDCYSCNKCGNVLNDIILPETLSFKESQNYDYTVTIDYKRINYFIEWLNQIQGREHANIPEKLISEINEELVKEKLFDTSRIKPPIIRRILKKIGESKYYEHIPVIISIIAGIPPLDIPPIIEEKLKFMFNEIQGPWEQFKDPTRTSFFSYPVVIHKFCQILNLNEYLPYFPLLKSREKLYKQEVVFEKIVNFLAKENQHSSRNKVYDIDWRYIKSM